MSQFSSSPPRSKLPQLSGGASRSPSPSVSLAQRSSEGPLLSTLYLSQLSSVNRSPSPAIGVGVTGGIGRSPSPAMATTSNSPQSSETPPPPKKRRLFHRELKYMMHGFGDDPNPYSETVDLMEELVVQFVMEMTLKAMEVGKSGRVHVNDIIFIIRKDRKKYSRVKDLLMMKEQIDKAKKALSEDSEAIARR